MLRYSCSSTGSNIQDGCVATGLAQCGAWACFDEFNRIGIEVLSVVAQQLMTIQSALRAGVSKFRFEVSRLYPEPHSLCAVAVLVD